MNVLIIGSTVFIGKRLTKFLFNESFNLYGLSKNKNKLLEQEKSSLEIDYQNLEKFELGYPVICGEIHW